MGAVYLLTLRQLSGRWRLVIMAALAIMPVLLATLSVRQSSAPSVSAFEIAFLGTFLAGTITPLVVLAIASVAFANELEDRTLANLTLSPIPRWHIVVPKLAAAVTVSGPFIVVSALWTGHIAFAGDRTAMTAVGAALFIAVLLYSAAFVWTGLMSTRAIGYGLVYVVMWEGFFSQFVTGIRFLSIRHYAIALMHVFDSRRFATADPLSARLAVTMSLLVFFGFLFLSVRRLRRMDVP